MTGSTWSFGVDYGAVYLIKTDSNGDTVWTRFFDGIYSDEANSVIQTSDGGYILAGRWGGNYAWLIKTDSSGNTGCGKNYTSTSVASTSTQIGSGCILGSGGEVLIPGSFGLGDVGSTICDLCLSVDFDFTDSILTVSFSDMSVGATSWDWEFGDGNTSTAQDPVHTYDSSGNYEVCLTASNACFGETLCKTYTPCLSIEASPDTTICDGDTAQLTSTLIDSAIYSWSPTSGLSNPAIREPLAFPTVTTTYTITTAKYSGNTSFWSEDFSSYSDGATWGINGKWNSTCSGCSGPSYFKVKSNMIEGKKNRNARRYMDLRNFQYRKLCRYQHQYRPVTVRL